MAITFFASSYQPALAGPVEEKFSQPYKVTTKKVACGPNDTSERWAKIFKGKWSSTQAVWVIVTNIEPTINGCNVTVDYRYGGSKYNNNRGGHEPNLAGKIYGDVLTFRSKSGYNIKIRYFKKGSRVMIQHPKGATDNKVKAFSS